MNIVHDEQKMLFSCVVDGFECVVGYELHGHIFDVVKTFVPKEVGGRGIAGALVKAAYDYGKEQDYELVATCSYAVVWLERHKEYQGRASDNYVEGACRI